jgi:uncharacterized membrane protein
MLTFEQPLLLLFVIPVGVLVFLTWRNMSLPFPRVQKRFILVSRLLLFSLVLAALAGMSLSLPVTRQSVVFVGDISASTQGQQAFIEQWVSNAIHHKRPDDRVGIVAVGRNALVEESMQNTISFSHFQSAPDTNYTDLAAGLRLASAILPADSMRRIVLLTDGQQNLGDALQEAQLLQQQGIRLDIVPLPNASGVEARVDSVTAPTTLRVNERFSLHLRLSSTVVQDGTLHLYLDQNLIAQQPVHLIAGTEEVTFTLLAPPPGFHTFRVTLNAPQDTLTQNNEGAAFVNVQGPPRVLVIEGQAGDGQNILSALHATKIDTVVGTPSDVPATLDGLVPYSAVVLANVPAASLGTARMKTLQSFVRDLGRGLVVSGGENSYGVGGYAGTPLEETLPVRMDIPQHKDTPSIAVVLIIESLEAQDPINISKEAAKGVISLLTPNDQVGISEGNGNLVIPMQHVTNKASLDKAIDNMSPTDPGSYLPDFNNAEQVLLHTNAKIKHVILLGDGDADQDNYAPQILRMAQEQITVSTVATNADTGGMGLMYNIATWGRGRFYNANNTSAIPQILLKETQQAARRAIINEPFTPAVVGANPILTGLSGYPELDGYVATTPKPTAQLVLVSHLDDPVLAVWQYGLGRVAAWTSDALGQWTTHWLTWNNAARWWANLVTWAIPPPDSALTVNGNVSGGAGHLIVDVPSLTTSATGASNQQQVQVRIVAPDYSQQSVTLQPTAPQRWEGNFPALQVGAYILQVVWHGPTQQGSGGVLTTTTGLVVPYSPEYRTQGTDTRFLTLLAQAGGGSILSTSNTTAAFAHNLRPVSSSLPLAFFLLALAALLLPIDVALRRLSSLEFLALSYQWLRSHLFSRQEQAATSSDETLASPLSAVRVKRQEQREAIRSAQPTRTVPTIKPVTPVVPSPSRPSTTATIEREAKPVPQPTSPVAAKQQEGTMASKLLEAKRKRSGNT